jgi:hypothetical protein
MVYFTQNFSQAQPPNQSLKLTEPAVDDFAARKKFLRERHYLPRVYSTGNWLHVAAA